MDIKEIFFSYQAEGIYIGAPTIFIRFQGCNLDCYYCDERKAKKIIKSKNEFSVDKIVRIISNIIKNKKNIKFISITGGEPLIHKNLEILLIKLKELKKKFNFRIYLETNGSVSNYLSKIIKYIDVVAIDFKNPIDSLQNTSIDLIKEFKRCIKICRESKKSYFVKLIISGRKRFSKRIISIIKNTIKSLKLSLIILQPVTNEFKSNKKNLFLNVCDIFHEIKNDVKHIFIIPQLHKTVWEIK
ncbi:MAG: 7-carboxy-7-deazaguanine synthase QueE [Elusimicrobiota bacterium]|nr:7-carboxy-7-deazaguanine synthase QueE [Endomicrobiia bacterium]MCX7910498.1 7-carboxy-7-deazaguanine synthase QueE [Endomicrobiia bacterium]MDW8166002.1 7-carboxy-7-deazaguanine synthase QueE [Elusimicrobiota bacterium]